MKIKLIVLVTMLTLLSLVVLIGRSSLNAELKTAKVFVGKAGLIVEVARNAESREKGLMFREELPKGTGMLFIYPKPTIVELWMKNTSLPLSAAFIDKDFFITEIIKMEELYSTRIYRSRNQAKYCIEVPLGWFEENGVAPGDMLVIPEGSVLE